MKKFYKQPANNLRAIKLPCITVLVSLTLLTFDARAQSPSVSYGKGVKTFTIGKTRTLVPTSTNVTPAGYSPQRDTINIGNYTNYSFAVDNKGYIYHSDAEGVYRIPVNGGARSLIIAKSGYSSSKSIAVDLDGNIFLTCDGSVRKYPAGGGVTYKQVFTKSPSPNGPGATELITDENNNLYIANVDNYVPPNPPDGQLFGNIVQIQSTGSRNDIYSLRGTNLVLDADHFFHTLSPATKKIETFTAKNSYGYLNVTLKNPTWLFTDAANNIYATDEDGVKQIAYNRTTVKTLLTGFTGSGSKLQSVIMDKKGVLYIATSKGTGTTPTVYLQSVKPAGGYFIDKPLPKGLQLDNTTGVISGKADYGSIAKDYKIYAYSASGIIDSTTVTIRVAATNADLADLDTYGHVPPFLPKFNKDSLIYNQVSTANREYQYYIRPTVSDPTSSIKINGRTAESGQLFYTPILEPGLNVFKIVVTSVDSSATKTYTLNVTRPKSNANLTSITVDGNSVGTASPTYYAAVNTTKVTVYATPSDPMATVKINGTSLNPATPGVIVNTDYGSTVVPIVCTAQNGNTNTYNLTIQRFAGQNNLSGLTPSEGKLSPAFYANGTKYRDTVSSKQTSIRFRLKTVDDNAVATLNGMPTTASVFSDPIPLAIGDNVSTIEITAPNGLKKTITITVYRPAIDYNVNLSSQRLSTKSRIVRTSASTSLNTYTASVGTSTSSVKITAFTVDPAVTIKINGTMVASGTESNLIPLNSSGTTTVNTVVTAPNGVNKVYRLVIGKYGSSDANLSKHMLSSDITLVKDKTSSVFNSYTANISNNISSVKLTNFTSDPAATFTVNEISGVTGVESAPIIINPNGPTVINTVVTAPDGVTTKVYQITLAHQSSSLMALKKDNFIIKKSQTQRAESDIVVHQGLSPNGDGINDVLTIDGISAYPNNKVSIMDQTGTVVYQVQGYDNLSNTFAGYTSTGKKVQAGTYFYSLEYKDGDAIKRTTGYLLIKY